MCFQKAWQKELVRTELWGSRGGSSQGWGQRSAIWTVPSTDWQGLMQQWKCPTCPPAGSPLLGWVRTSFHSKSPKEGPSVSPRGPTLSWEQVQQHTLLQAWGIPLSQQQQTNPAQPCKGLCHYRKHQNGETAAVGLPNWQHRAKLQNRVSKGVT